jgi:hypothetical protein
LGPKRPKWPFLGFLVDFWGHFLGSVRGGMGGYPQKQGGWEITGKVLRITLILGPHGGFI